ncbi:MAG: helix-turn-helix transcriptional regulator [Oscillospiraceae bacterium]|nr:helix-turn-helix transcriptional regulator [Oscillospiraceae bacterium]
MIFTNISNLCEKKGISIARLERECGLGNATVRGWKNSMPTADKLKRVADYLGVSVDSLMAAQEN